MKKQKFSYRQLALALTAALFLILALAVGTSSAQDAQQTGSGQASTEDTANQNNQIKNNLNWHKDLLREVNDIKRETKNTVNAATAEKYLSEYAACIAAKQSLVGTADFWSSYKDCEELSRLADVELQDNLRPARDCANNRKNIDNRVRERKGLDRQVKDILRNDKTADVSSLNASLAAIDAALAKAAQYEGGICSRDGADALRDIEQDLNGLFQDFYNGSNDLNQKSNETRRITDGKNDYEKNIKRNCEKDKAREFKNYTREYEKVAKKGAVSAEAAETYAAVKALYEDLCVTLVGAMGSALAVNDIDAFEDARQKYWDSDRDFWDTLNNSRSTLQEVSHREETLKNVNRDLQQKTKDLSRMKKELTRTKKVYERAAKKYADRQERKDNIAAFGQFVSQAADLISKMEAGITAAKDQASADPDSYWYDKNEELNDLQMEFNDLQNNVNNILNIMQTVKDVEQLLKNFRSDLKNIAEKTGNDENVISTLEGLLSESDVALKQVWALAITDPEEALSTLQSMQELEAQWYDTLNEWSEQNGDRGSSEEYENY